MPCTRGFFGEAVISVSKAAVSGPVSGHRVVAFLDRHNEKFRESYHGEFEGSRSVMKCR